MRRQHAVTSAEILEKVKGYVAPLPSQAAYMKDLAALLAMHMNRNLLIDDGYAYWYNRLKKAKESTDWSESDVYDLDSAFIKFKEKKVLMRQKYKSNEITFQELYNWFLDQRNIVDEIMKKHGT